MKNKPGFHATLIVVILLAIVLAGAVGYILWNNTSGNTKSNSNMNNSEEGKNNTQGNNVTAKSYAADKSKLGYNFGFEYLSNWVLKENYKPADAAKYEITITSPTSKTQVYYKIGYQGGIGGTCNPNDYFITKMGSLDKFSFEPTKSGVGYLIELLFLNNNKVMESKTYITEKLNFEKGNDYCSTYLTDFVQLKPYTYADKDQNGWSVIWNANITLSDIQNSDGTIKSNITSQNVTDARSTEEYKQARNILLSTTYSKL